MDIYTPRLPATSLGFCEALRLCLQLAMATRTVDSVKGDPRPQEMSGSLKLDRWARPVSLDTDSLAALRVIFRCWEIFSGLATGMHTDAAVTAAGVCVMKQLLIALLLLTGWNLLILAMLLVLH